MGLLLPALVLVFGLCFGNIVVFVLGAVVLGVIEDEATLADVLGGGVGIPRGRIY